MEEFDKFVSDSRLSELITTKMNFAKYIIWLIQEHYERVKFLQRQLSAIKTDISDLILREKPYKKLRTNDHICGDHLSPHPITPSKFKLYDHFKNAESKKKFENECKEFSKSINKKLSNGRHSYPKILTTISECSAENLFKSEEDLSSTSERHFGRKRSSVESFKSMDEERLSISRSSSVISRAEIITGRNIYNDHRKCDLKSAEFDDKKRTVSKVYEDLKRGDFSEDYKTILADMSSLFTNNNNKQSHSSSLLSQESFTSTKTKHNSKSSSCSDDFEKNLKNRKKQLDEENAAFDKFLNFINKSPHLTVDAVYAPLSNETKSKSNFKMERAQVVGDFAMSWPRYIKFNLKNVLEPNQEKQHEDEESFTENVKEPKITESSEIEFEMESESENKTN